MVDASVVAASVVVASVEAAVVSDDFAVLASVFCVEAGMEDSPPS